MKLKTAIAFVALGIALPLSAARAEVSEIRITKQPGALYWPMILMEYHKLIEKQSVAAGLPEVKASWPLLTSGGIATDALLSGSIDVVTSGVSNMLLLWSKTNGAVKAVFGVAGLPFKLVTRNPDVKTIKDFGPKDRIAVPTIKMSMQAITLGIASQKVWGDDKANEKLLTNQVQMGHPDATAALLNPVHEVNSHFSSSPFQEMALKNPNIHSVLDSRDALGGAAHVAVAFTTTKFYDENPKVIRVLFAAYEEALAMMKKDTKAAAEAYLAITKEKLTPEELVALYQQDGAIYQAAPVRTMIYADYMFKAGFINKQPASWKDYFFPLIQDRTGN
jgi:NitT/TauT family transport system substrate-binding protein